MRPQASTAAKPCDARPSRRSSYSAPPKPNDPVSNGGASPSLTFPALCSRSAAAGCRSTALMLYVFVTVRGAQRKIRVTKAAKMRRLVNLCFKNAQNRRAIDCLTLFDLSHKNCASEVNNRKVKAAVSPGCCPPLPETEIGRQRRENQGSECAHSV